MLTIAGTEFNATHNAYEIYVAGCKQHCPGCHNPELQVFGKGKSARLWLKENRFKLRTDTFDKVWILGGDLLSQPLHDAVEFVTSLRHAMPLSMHLWLWTGAVESVDAIPPMLRELFDYIKTGAYRKDHLSVLVLEHNIVLASDNQKITRIGVPQ